MATIARMLTRLATAAAAALVLAVAGCGGAEGAGSGGEAAGIVPASAAVYVSINADVESDQWQQLLELVRRFPDHERLESQLLQSLSEEGVDWRQDVDPAFGPEVAIAVLQGNGDQPLVVGLPQPDDQAKFDALLQRGDEPSVKEEIDGWIVVSDTQAGLDAFRTAREDGTLADADAFKDAVDGLPGESLAVVYVGGEGARSLAGRLSRGAASGAQLGDFESFAAAITSSDDGFRLEGVARGVAEGDAGAPYTPELLDRVPAESLAVLSLKGQSAQFDRLRQSPALSQQLVEVERLLGVQLEQIAGLFQDEGVLYVRSAAPFPEATMYLRVADEAEAKRTLDTLAQKLASLVEGQVVVKQTTIEGTQATEIDAGPVSVYVAVRDGLLVLTSSPSGIRGAAGVDDSLADNEDFANAKDAAGLGDETSGFLYVDLDALVPLIEGFAGVAEQEVPPEVARNLEPLDAFVLYADRDGDEATVAGFLGIHQE